MTHSTDEDERGGTSIFDYFRDHGAAGAALTAWNAVIGQFIASDLMTRCRLSGIEQPDVWKLSDAVITHPDIPT